MNGAIHPLPNMPSWSGTQLKHRDNFTFHLRLENSRLRLTSALFSYVGICDFMLAQICRDDGRSTYIYGQLISWISLKRMSISPSLCFAFYGNLVGLDGPSKDVCIFLFANTVSRRVVQRAQYPIQGAVRGKTDGT